MKDNPKLRFRMAPALTFPVMINQGFVPIKREAFQTWISPANNQPVAATRP